MGISSEIRLFAKEEKEAIEIYPLEAEDTKNSECFSIDYLFNHVVLQEINDISFDISKISVLELSMCKLTDLPLACKKLNLKYLGLSHNQLDHIPLCLYNGMKHLESLDLSYNKIQNFDMEPDCLPYIKTMKLNNNEFENIPKWFLMFRCTSMEEFNYSNNKAQNYKFLKNSFNLHLIKLKRLELVNSCLIDQDLCLLKCFKQLQYLDISSDNSRHINRFDDLDVLFVKPKWDELNVLKLNGLSLSIFPEGIAWIETLKELHVCNNSLSWLPDDIGFLVNLEVLNVSNNNLISLPDRLVSLEKLKVLQASTNYIEGAPDISLLSNLKTLDLFDNLLREVSFNVNTVDFIDIEYNYCDTKEFEEVSLYEDKKISLRAEYSVKERYDGPKINKSEDLSDSDSESVDSYYESLTDVNKMTLINSDEDENWDLPVKDSKINSDIDSEDDKWQGDEDDKWQSEDSKPRVKRNSEKQRVYVSDDDWMFVDYDES